MKHVIILLIAWCFSFFTAKSQCITTPPSQTLNEKAEAMLANKALTYPFTFAIITDAHNNVNSWPNPIWSDILADVETEIANANIDFVINVGDFIDQGDENNCAYTHMSTWMDTHGAPYGTPFFSVAGNHDTWWNSGNEGYDEYISKKANKGTDYQFDFKFEVEDFLFILTDNYEKTVNVPNWNKPSFELNQINRYAGWINDITNPDLNILSFTHIPITPNYGNSWPYLDAFHDNILENKGVRANFSGHMHTYKVYENFGNFYEFNLGAAGFEGNWNSTQEKYEPEEFGDCDPKDPISPHKFDDAASWVKVTVYENKEVKTELHYIDGLNVIHDSEYDFIIPETKDINLNVNKTVGQSEYLNYYTWHNIYAAGATNYIVDGNGSTGGNVVFEAAQKIHLYPGFKAEKGSHYIGRIRTQEEITYCSFPTERLSNEPNNKEELPNSLENNTAINIYPNPNTGQFNIELKANEENAIIEIYDIMGKIVSTHSNVRGNVSIDIDDHPKGVYLVKITIGNEVFNEKIIYQ